MVNLLEEMKRKVLKRDRVCEPVLENLRQYFTQLLPEMIESREEIINPVAVRQYNFLVDMTFKFLDYLENHKKYQARCSKITSSIHNIVRNEIETIQKESKEMIVGIFSLIDDLCEDKDKVWDPFVEIMENATLKNNTPEDQWISKLENLVMEKDLYFLMQRHSLFDLEKKGVIKNFSFDKGSKFFDMYDRVTQRKGHLLRHREPGEPRDLQGDLHRVGGQRHAEVLPAEQPQQFHARRVAFLHKVPPGLPGRERDHPHAVARRAPLPRQVHALRQRPAARPRDRHLGLQDQDDGPR